MAEHLNAEIVSADSRQIFRGLDVGTAKPDAEERARVAHHFVDELNPGEPWAAGRFAERANERIRAILDGGQAPLVVGGSTLYLEALVHGLAPVPAADLAVRAELMREIASGKNAALFEELRRVDVTAAATLDPTKSQRLVRALEVYRTTGRPISSFHAVTTDVPHSYRVVVLTRPRDVLYRRIEQRVEQMLADGLVEENRRLLAAGYRLDTNPLRTIGYQEPIAYLEGAITHAEMVSRLKRNTRRYAKRQLTWFRRHSEYEWIDLHAVDAGGLREILLQ